MASSVTGLRRHDSLKRSRCVCVEDFIVREDCITAPDRTGEKIKIEIAAGKSPGYSFFITGSQKMSVQN
jgi:hypothetical protein